MDEGLRLETHAGSLALMSKRAVVYARVSLDVSGDGRSVERQEEACRKLADLRGWEVVEVIVDNSISAWSGKERPGWARVLDLVARGAVDVVLAWHLDRMTRSMVELEELIRLAEATGVGLVTATGDIDLTTDVGRMVARILAAVARAEVERKAARQRLANAQRARSGLPSLGGMRAFGYGEDGVEVVPAEAELIRDAAERVLNGCPLGQIAREWNEKGYRSASSEARGSEKGWSRTGVRKVLANPRYAGLSVYQGEVVGIGQWPAILDRGVHERLVRLFSDEARFTGKNRGGRHPQALLSGLATCGRCDNGVVNAANSRNARRGDPARYKCRSCGMMVPRSIVDAFLGEVIVTTVLSSRPYLAELSQGQDGALTGLLEEVTALRQRIVETREDRAAGLLDRKTFLDLDSRLRTRLERLQGQIAAASPSPTLDSMLGAEDVAQRWAESTLEARRGVIDALFDVQLASPGVGRRFNPTEGVILTPKWS